MGIVRERPTALQVWPALETLRARMDAQHDAVALQQALVFLHSDACRAISRLHRQVLQHPEHAFAVNARVNAHRTLLTCVERMSEVTAGGDVDAVRNAYVRIEVAATAIDLVSRQASPAGLQSTAARWMMMVDRLLSALNGAHDPPHLDLLLELAENLASHGVTPRAFEVARRVLEGTEARAATQSRKLIGSLVPSYHLPMMNDERRNAAWDRALRRAVRPGMHVLEIGTGAGMLSLMAARAGAARVTTCEFNPVVAAMAREVAERNGYGDRIHVINKLSNDLMVGEDLEGRADLVFCDNFSDNMFSFEPLKSLGDARSRLLVEHAPCVPMRAAVRLAPISWTAYDRYCRADRSAGFDISPAHAFVPESLDLKIGDDGVKLLSPHQEPFSFDLNAASYPSNGHSEMTFEIQRGGVVHGIVQWIRLDLDEETVLEARPEPGAVAFSNPRLYPLPSPRTMGAGESLRVFARHDGRWLTVWT